MATARNLDHKMLGRGTYVATRVGGVLFPARRVVGDSGVVADLGRYSVLSIYFGRGQRVRLADGRVWRTTAVRSGGGLAAVIADENGRRLAQANPGVGNYGITIAGDGYTLDPADGGRGRSNHWLLTYHGETHAILSRRPHSAVVEEPIALGVGLLGLLLALTGIPGEGEFGLPSPWG